MFRCIAPLLVVIACGESLPRTSLISSPATATPALRDACDLTEYKCTRCHTIGRVLAFSATTRADWEPVVASMRQMVSSGITLADEQVILSCLEKRR